MNGVSYVAGIATAIVGVAILTVVLRKSSDTANVIKATGQAFSSSLGVAMGSGSAQSPLG